MLGPRCDALLVARIAGCDGLLEPRRRELARWPRGERASSAQQKRLHTAETRSCSLHGVLGTHRGDYDGSGEYNYHDNLLRKELEY